jgi:hypothetical protein
LANKASLKGEETSNLDSENEENQLPGKRKSIKRSLVFGGESSSKQRKVGSSKNLLEKQLSVTSLTPPNIEYQLGKIFYYIYNL